MGLNYLWDTNIVIYFLQMQLKPTARNLIEGILRESTPAISVITELELLSWPAVTDGDKKLLDEFIKDSYIYELDASIKIQTVLLRKSKGIKLPDAIIASTAITQNLTLLSHNAKDFSKIPGLMMIDPIEAGN